MVSLNPLLLPAAARLTKGLGLALGPYAGLLRADSVGLTLESERQMETGAVRLAGYDAPTSGGVTRFHVPNGPLVRHRLTVRGDSPGIELDLTVLNGETTGPRTPHVLHRELLIQAPAGFAIIPRFEWIRVTRRGPSLFAVDLGTDVYQGCRLSVALAIVPGHLVSGGEGADEDEPVSVHPLAAAALRDAPHLDARGAQYVDGFDRTVTGDIGYLDRVRERAREDALAFIRDGYGSGEFASLVGDYGGWGSGSGIRFDYFAEFEAALDEDDLYHLANRWLWEVERRPQRGYLTDGGEPLQLGRVLPGFGLSIGPTERMIPNQSANVYGFDEDWIDSHKYALAGSYDLQHAPRFFAPYAFLAQRFQTPFALDAVRDMAAAARLDCGWLRDQARGMMDRGEAWTMVLNALDLKLNGTQQSREWLEDAVATVLDHQTAHGGICAWTHNKEATVYARQFRFEFEALGASVQSYTDLPVYAVTQTYQETMFLYALWLASRCDLDVDAGDLTKAMRRLATFICETCRDPLAPAPWYRCDVDGKRASTNTSSYYYGTALRVALAVDCEDADEWVRAFAGSDDALGALARSNVPQWNNRWHLIAYLQS